MSYAKNMTIHRVRHSETDDWGIGYYGSYFSWFEEGRTELLRKIGIDVGIMENMEKMLVPVIEAKNNYFAPVHFDDELKLESSLTEIGNTHFRVDYFLCKGTQKICQGYTVHVFTDRNLKKKEVHEKMAKLKEKNQKQKTAIKSK